MALLRTLVTALNVGSLVSMSFFAADRKSSSAPNVSAASAFCSEVSVRRSAEPADRDTNRRHRRPQLLSGGRGGAGGGFIEKATHEYSSWGYGARFQRSETAVYVRVTSREVPVGTPQLFSELVWKHRQCVGPQSSKSHRPISGVLKVA